jgi:hypothetical protein
MACMRSNKNAVPKAGKTDELGRAKEFEKEIDLVAMLDGKTFGDRLYALRRASFTDKAAQEVVNLLNSKIKTIQIIHTDNVRASTRKDRECHLKALKRVPIGKTITFAKNLILLELEEKPGGAEIYKCLQILPVANKFDALEPEVFVGHGWDTTCSTLIF